MTWNLFIDDERNLEDVTWAPWQIREKYRNEEWVIARTDFEVYTELAKRKSFPSFISFDHDLGLNSESGFKIAAELIDRDMLEESWVTIPDDFDFYVHSKNPIGKANIEGLLNSYLKHKGK